MDSENGERDTPPGIESLPYELLIHIASNLDQTAPSVAKFSHEPSPNLTCADETPLKAFSLVCWRWRKAALPILFHYTRIPIDECPQWVPIDARLIESMQGQLSKLSNHELQIYTKMRTKFKSSSMFAFNPDFDDLLINLCRVEEDDNILKTVPNILWLPHLPRTYTDFTKFIALNNLKPHIKSVVVHTTKEYNLRHVPTADAPLHRAVTEIWTQIFLHLEPTRLVVAAPPTTLAGLLDTQILSADAWAFKMDLHYIELLQPPSPQAIIHKSSSCRPWDAALIHRRPWHHLSYNEGSSIKAYSTYEYHLKQTPKILFFVLLRLAQECSECCGLRSFAFTAVFPLSTNLVTTIKALQRIHTLEHVRFQIAPGKENDLLDNKTRLEKAEPRDLWLEWNSNYDTFARFLARPTFEDGSTFVSLDCGGVWEDGRWVGDVWVEGRECVDGVENKLAVEVEEHVEARVKQGTGWVKRGVGRWIRDKRLDREVGVGEGGEVEAVDGLVEAHAATIIIT